MAEVSHAELQQLLANIANAAHNYDGKETVRSKESRAAIRGAARDLFLTMCTPEEHSWYQVLHMTELVALRTCIELGVFEHIPPNGAASAETIGKATNATPSLIDRMLRILVGTGFLDQTRPDGGDYKHTKSSLHYRDVTIASPGTFFKSMYDVYLRPALGLDKWIEEKFKGKYSEPSSNFENPFVSHYGHDGQSAWDVMAGIPDTMKTFQTCLKAVDEVMPPSGPFYDFSQFGATATDPERIQIVDVGGGYGKVLRDIVQATPALNPKYCVVQDSEPVIAAADAARDFGLQTMAIDFHASQPTHGARAYYMRFICHDYSDQDIINILSHVAKAMAPDSKLLIAESVIPDRLQEATITAGVFDQLMLCFGGKERTAGGYRSILEPNGLELVSMNKVAGSTGAIIEVRLKLQPN